MQQEELNKPHTNICILYSYRPYFPCYSVSCQYVVYLTFLISDPFTNKVFIPFDRQDRTSNITYNESVLPTAIKDFCYTLVYKTFATHCNTRLHLFTLENIAIDRSYFSCPYANDFKETRRQKSGFYYFFSLT